jgi:hypothetical protein
MWGAGKSSWQDKEGSGFLQVPAGTICSATNCHWIYNITKIRMCRFLTQLTLLKNLPKLEYVDF